MIIKSKLIKRFAQIPNDIAQSGNLSIEAIGLMTYLLSLPDDWVVNKEHLRSHFKMGKQRIRKIMSELIESGYIIEVDQINGEDGKFKRKNYIVYDEPLGSPKTQPLNQNPSTVNGSLQIHKEKTHIEQINNKRTVGDFSTTVEILNLFFIGYADERIKGTLSDNQEKLICEFARAFNPEKVIEMGKYFKEAGWSSGQNPKAYMDDVMMKLTF